MEKKRNKISLLISLLFWCSSIYSSDQVYIWLARMNEENKPRFINGYDRTVTFDAKEIQEKTFFDVLRKKRKEALLVFKKNYILLIIMVLVWEITGLIGLKKKVALLF